MEIYEGRYQKLARSTRQERNEEDGLEVQGKKGVRRVRKQRAQEGYGLFHMIINYKIYKSDYWKKKIGRITQDEENRIRIKVYLRKKILGE